MLVSSIFFFFHNVFKMFIFYGRKNSGLCCKDFKKQIAFVNLIQQFIVKFPFLSYSQSKDLSLYRGFLATKGQIFHASDHLLFAFSNKNGNHGLKRSYENTERKK